MIQQCKFLEEIEKNYDNKLGFDSKLKDLKSEINKLNNELSTVQRNLAYQWEVALTLNDLMKSGFNHQQILNLAWALQSNSKSLEADLKIYGSLKKSNET